MSCCNRSRPLRIAHGVGAYIMGMNSELSQERLKVCRNCPEMRNGLSCNLCGCILEAKTRVPDEFCPAGKWKAQTYPGEPIEAETIDVDYTEAEQLQLNAASVSDVITGEDTAEPIPIENLTERREK